jgi:hypothetical protein
MFGFMSLIADRFGAVDGAKARGGVDAHAHPIDEPMP